MRYLLTIIVTLMPLFGNAKCSRGDSLSIEMVTFKKGCLQMLKGIETKDRYCIYEAQELFEKINTDGLKIISVDSTLIQNELPPKLIFSSSFCDSLLMHNLDFSIINCDGMSQLKGEKDSIMVALYQKGIRSNSNLIYQVFGCEHCEMMIITDKPNSIRFSIISQRDMSECKGEMEPNGLVLWTILELPIEGDDLILKIENISQDDSNFVIVAK